MKPKKLAAALNARVRFENQDPDEQFYPARCGNGKHYWHENADAEGDTCNCGEWQRYDERACGPTHALMAAKRKAVIKADPPVWLPEVNK